MPVIATGEADQLEDAVADGEEDPVNVRPAETVRPRLSRHPQQLPKPGLHLEQILPGDAGVAFQIPIVRIRVHGLHLS
jgi:hypothetical protein